LDSPCVPVLHTAPEPAWHKVLGPRRGLIGRPALSLGLDVPQVGPPHPGAVLGAPPRGDSCQN
jgi:hypothetical protein